jgi:tetratricopeptide (TPR) repeat protein
VSPRLAPLVAALVAFVLALSSPSRAADEDARERASRSFGEAKAAFALHQYTAAAAAFEEAARLVPHPATWLDAAAAREAAGDPARAAEDCDRALALADEPGPSADALRRLERLAPKIATVELRGRPALLARVDGGDPIGLPAKRRLAPGHHRVVVREAASGEERSVELDLAAGDARTVDLDAALPPLMPAPAPAPAPDPAPERPAPLRRAGSGPPLGSTIAFGAAGVGGAIATVFGVLTLDAKSNYERTPTHATLDTFKADRLTTNIALGTAVIAAAVGVTVWLLVR